MIKKSFFRKRSSKFFRNVLVEFLIIKALHIRIDTPDDIEDDTDDDDDTRT